MFVIQQAPENVRDDYKQRKNETLHMEVRRRGNQCCRRDDSCLGEPPAQKVQERMLHGAAQDDLLQNAKERLRHRNPESEKERVASKERKRKDGCRRKLRQGENPFDQGKDDNEDSGLEQCVGERVAPVL